MRGLNRIVNTSFWQDEKAVNDFSPEDKYFFLYLLTNPHTTQLGIYKLVPKTAAFELGYSQDTVMCLLDRFENKYGIIKFSRETSEIAIKNYLRHSIVKGGKPVMDCLIKEEKDVKDKSLLAYIYNNLKTMDNLNITVKEYLEHIERYLFNDNDNDNERIVHESYHESYHESSGEGLETIKSVVDYLNSVCVTKYRYQTPKTQKLIRARLSEGFTEDDFKTVIDKKYAQWGNDSKMSEYLRPETLFGTKFESYLNQKETKTIAEEMRTWL